jgi:nanoRNase/pAp phosphatase (c-di-AMP/oligoRNAs hydrolase)
MSEGCAFSATYYDISDARVFSLRSSKDGIDVSKVAVQYGGGGHPHAAGFKVKKPNLTL